MGHNCSVIHQRAEAGEDRPFAAARGKTSTTVPQYRNIDRVRVIGIAKLDEFVRRNARARVSLANWEKVVRAAAWKNFAEMKRTFNSVDHHAPKTIFHIGGNNFRLIALVDFRKQLVQVTDIMTHADYDKEGGSKLWRRRRIRSK
jgi:mRNA interferase HigB